MSDDTDTDYEVGQDNVQIFGLDIHNPVFAVSGLTILAFVFFTLVFQEQAGTFFGWLRPALTSQFDWVFMLAGNIFVVFSLLLIVTPFGRIRLGGDDAKPDYSYAGWFAMLFAAGMGIGLVFWGVAEPISHYGTSLGGTALGDGGVRTDWAPLGAAANDPEAAKSLAMAATIFHWGLHPWAIYAVVALALAYFGYNKGLPLTMRSVFYPIFGEATWGPIGHVIDVLAVFATIFGLATS
ncbi:MAG: BCCT family transporter, partial [Pseudomonadota bacterium]|nr:BCCT family transporter [Pseudomonadota bacterium]